MPSEFPQSLVRPAIRALAPYSTARDESEGGYDVYLDANESPYGASGLNRYPDPRWRSLRAAVGRQFDAAPEQIFLGNGSDEAIDLLYRVLCTPGRSNTVSIAPTYGMYGVAAAINGVEMREVPLKPGFGLPADDILQACDAQTAIVWVCSPNNPTGNAFPLDQLRRLAEAVPGILVVDEAYADFSGQSLLPELVRFPRLVVLRTFSKAWGLAGARLGMAFAHPDLVEYMCRVKYPYNVNLLTQRAAMQALGEPDRVRREVALTVSERRRVAEALQSNLEILDVYPSDANFLLVRVADAAATYRSLAGKGIIVRRRDNLPMCQGCLRLSIGTPEENNKLLQALTTTQQ